MYKICHIASEKWKEMYGNNQEYMKLCLVDNLPSIKQFEGWLTPCDNSIKVVNECMKDCDFIICWGVTQMENTKKVAARFPHVPIINYNWDIYEWAVKNPRPNEYNYREYVKFLAQSFDIWVPSESVKRRTIQWCKEWEGVDVHPHIILSHTPIWDAETSDGNYVLNTQRANPDERLGWFERACEELKIPYKSPEHKLPQDEFRKVLANCTFQVSHYYEMSTGGLAILEGYYLGKPVLLSNSEWQGGIDYMGSRAEYFQHDDFEDLKKKIKDMWENRRKLPTDYKQWIKDNYSEKAIAERIYRRLKKICKKSA